MPKLIDYPRRSFRQSLDLAAAVDHLGDNCTPLSVADQLKMAPSGHFYAIVSSASKHNLIESRKGSLCLTDSYKTLKHAYGEEEKINLKRASFLFPGLYLKVYDRFKGKPLPIDMLGKMFIREFGVEESVAPKIAGYFIEGAELCGLLVNGNMLDINTSSGPTRENTTGGSNNSKEDISRNIDQEIRSIKAPTDGTFIVHILGAGIDSKLTLSEQEDFAILDAMINKLKKKIKNSSGEGI